jgi:peptide/nickel transport system permease protein
MWAYLVKRILLIFITLLGICMISFVLVTLAPGDPAATAAGIQAGSPKGRGHNTDEVLEHIRTALYLDRPVLLNFAPSTRRSVARDYAKKICEGSEYNRENVGKTVLGGIGTAGLDVFIEEASARAKTSTEVASRVKKALEAVEALAKNPGADAAALALAIEPLEKTFPGRGPRFSRKATPEERAQAWAAWGNDHASEPFQGVNGLLDLLAKLVPENAGGPPLPKGTALERAQAWSSWWEQNHERYAQATIVKAVAAYLDASTAAVASDRLADLVRIGGAATAPVMAELTSSTGERRLRAANALSLVAHKPWDLQVRTQDYEQTWVERRKKIEEGKLRPEVLDNELAALGGKEAFVARESALEVKSQEKSIARWWFRSEEEFTDFGVPRQISRSVTQTQFGNWFRALAGGLDFGKSFAWKKDVSTLIAERLPVTLWLNFFSLFLTYTIAIPLGIFSAAYPRSIMDRITTIGLFILYSLPSFWVGAILILLVTGPPIGVSWFPSHGVESMNSWQMTAGERFFDWIKHITLPVVCLTYGGIAYVSRQMRAGMLETIRQDYIRTARAKGLAENVVVFKHALRNSMIPTLTLLAYLLPSMFGGSVIIEQIFSIDGLGKLMFEAILARDYPVIMSEVFISGILTLLGVLLSDISYALVDPRIELK